mmetsp:Transcript_9497/g.17798  ORF Transcript_9497/g.17798 Transcript_9497/m.17798 type:complete len:207 (-) Transcript_9497:641-1261(-)
MKMALRRRPCLKRIFWNSGTSLCALGDLSSQPVRILTVTLLEGIWLPIALTISHSLEGRVISLLPAPRLQMTSIGQPQFRSTKSAVTSCSSTLANRCIWSGCAHATCTPKQVSASCLRSSAHSEGCPVCKLPTIAISPHVMSAPWSFITRRHGRLPIVVSGAMYTLLEKSTSFTGLSGSGVELNSAGAPEVDVLVDGAVMVAGAYT